MKKLKIIFFLSLLFSSVTISSAQPLTSKEQTKIRSYLTQLANKEISVGKVKIDSTSIKGKTIQIYTSTNFSYIPFDKKNVGTVYAEIKNLLPSNYKNYEIELITDSQKNRGFNTCK